MVLLLNAAGPVHHDSGLDLTILPDEVLDTANANANAPYNHKGSSFSTAAELCNTLQVMTNLYLAPFPRPATSLMADYPYEQGHKGWQVGVLSMPFCSNGSAPACSLAARSFRRLLLKGTLWSCIL